MSFWAWDQVPVQRPDRVQHQVDKIGAEWMLPTELSRALEWSLCLVAVLVRGLDSVLDSERFSSRMWRLKSRPSLSRCPQSLALHHSKQVVRLRHWALHIWSFASVEDVDLPNLMRKWVGCRISNFRSLALRELFSQIMEALKFAKMSEAHCPSGCANQSIFLSHHACLLTP